MNKTIIINMNGIIFHIEEDAYEVLRAYMIEVKKHFAGSADSDEIVTDIENRIAEMFTEQLGRDHKQVVVLSDVNEVVAQMGRVSDFEPESEQTEIHTPAGRIEKKLYRDPDDRVIGGVCAGIAHYFDIEPRWVRVIALLILLLGGSGLLIYVILWIIMPVARTRADKMAMMGEPINLQSFKKSFDEEVDAVRHNFSKTREEARPFLDKLENFFAELFEWIGKVFTLALRVIVKLIGVFIIIAGSVALFAAVVALLALLGFVSTTDLSFFPFNIINPEFRSAVYFSAFALVLIPIVGLILFALRIILNRQVITRTGIFAMLIIWLTALGVGIYCGSRIATQFKEEATFSQATELKASPVYYLKLNPVKYFTKEDSLRYGIDGPAFRGRVIIDGRDHNMPRNVNIQILRSDDDKAVVTESLSADGPNFEMALRTAQKVKYHFAQNDSVVEFDWMPRLERNELWRNQRVTLAVKVPKNVRLVIDGDLNQYVENVNLWDCQPENQGSDAPSEWLMTDEGLKCKNDSLFRSKRGEME